MIKPSIISLISSNYIVFFLSLILSIPTLAQVTVDGTTNTSVTSDGNNFTIEDGDRAGDNLFHSFQDFSLPTDGSAFFDNAVDIQNIFSRVTGGNISSIDGLIRANGTANLFLINPGGIVFGNNARLDIGGSFLGSTADSILFRDGELSALDSVNPPLLTINAPIGLSFRDEPADVVNQSVANNDNGLEVSPGKNITLVGGDVNLAGGNIFAPGGRVELGGLSASGDIGINPDGSLSFLDGIARADITLTNQATVDVSAGGGGSINLNASNVTLSERSKIFGGVAENTNSFDAQAGNITIDATESVRLMGNGLNIDEIVGLSIAVISGRVTTSNLEILTGIISQAQDAGELGNIIVNTPNLLLQDGGFLGSTVFANSNNNNTDNNTIQGSADVIISNAQQVELDSSFITTLANRNTDRKPGNITINSEHLVVKEGSAIASATFGNGDGGELTINASESIEVKTTLSGSLVPTIITSNSIFGAGKAGDITIDTKNLIVREGGAISSDSGGTIFVGENSNIGNILQPADFQIGSNGSILLIKGGAAGNLDIKADSIEISGTSVGNQFPSALTSESTTAAKAGNINIDTNQLTISHDAEVRVGSVLTGDGGNINIQTDSLILENQALISAQAIESADGGNVNINTDFIIASPNQNNDIIANAEQGTGGNINITAEGIFGLEERSSTPPNNTNDIDASSEFGLDGRVLINTPDLDTFSEAIEAPEIVQLETLGTNACSIGGTSGTSSLNITGKGGLPPKLTEPLTSDSIYVEGESFKSQTEETNHKFDDNTRETKKKEDKEENIVVLVKRTEPISIDDIVPARGAIVLENGDVILTPYPTNNVQRSLHNSSHCPQS